MKSLQFLKPTLATTLAIVLAWLLSVRPAQAGYIVTLRQVGPNVVATGSGAIDLRGLTFSLDLHSSRDTSNFPHIGHERSGMQHIHGAVFFHVPGSTTERRLLLRGLSGPTSFGSGTFRTFANSGSGDMVGIVATSSNLKESLLSVPRGYVSGTALSDSATYSGKTFATLGVTPGTYVWKWGTGANQNFTLANPTGSQHHQLLHPRLGPNRPRRYYRRIYGHRNRI